MVLIAALAFKFMLSTWGPADYSGVYEQMQNRPPGEEARKWSKQELDEYNAAFGIVCLAGVSPRGRNLTIDVGGLNRELTHRRNPNVDRNGAKPAGLQCNPPGGYGSLGEPGPGLMFIPLEELVEPQIVDSAGD